MSTTDCPRRPRSQKCRSAPLMSSPRPVSAADSGQRQHGQLVATLAVIGVVAAPEERESARNAAKVANVEKDAADQAARERLVLEDGRPLTLTELRAPTADINADARRSDGGLSQKLLPLYCDSMDLSQAGSVGELRER